MIKWYFEGSKRVTNPSILRRFWNISSTMNNNSFDDYNQNHRMKQNGTILFQVFKCIWPNVFSQRAQNLTTDILVLKYS